MPFKKFSKNQNKINRGKNSKGKGNTLVAILNKLDNKEAVTVHSIMNDFEISERSAYRYLQTLMTAEYPIFFDRGKGSYAFSEGYCLRKPNLSIEETLAFALAKKLLKNLGTGMEDGLATIEEKLSSKQADLPGYIVLSPDMPPAETMKCFGAIQQAMSNFKRLEIVYRALSYNEETVRKVDPYYLFLNEDLWHLRGYCHLREEPRTFALDRIVSVKLLNEHFLPKRITPDDELSGAFGAVVDGEPVDVVLRFDAEIKPYILRKKWHKSQTEKLLDDKRLEVRFTINGFEGIKQWIHRWLPNVEVVSPDELREAVTEELKVAMRKYKNGLFPKR